MLSPGIEQPEAALPLPASRHPISRPLSLRFNIVTVTFWALFVLIFLLSGVLTFATDRLYRMGLVSLLVAPLILRLGVRINWVFIGYAFLTLVVLASAVVNHSPIYDVIEFARTLAFSFLIYYLVSRYLTPQTVRKVLRTCITIGWLQLPVMLIQRIGFPYLPAHWKQVVQSGDIAFGTFNFKTDYAMTFFLALLVVLLLFENNRLQLVKNRWPHVVWFSVTILVANSQIMKLFLILIWVAYFLARFSLVTIIRSMALALIASAILWAVNSVVQSNQPITLFITNIQGVTSREEINDTDSYFEGNYSRSAAIKYLLTEGRSWLGDGPAIYQNAVTREQTRANHGHFFVFVSEIGWLGWFASVVVFGLIMFPLRGARIKVSMTRILALMGWMMLSFTSKVMNDVAVVMIFCIIASYHLLNYELQTEQKSVNIGPPANIDSQEALAYERSG